ncbi:MAG: aminotransferase class V-fold PLP-dependent enzyme [Alphaproteobacteria bacterium]|nr:aminotransferase class V-fold PLP-dependent enzyme [Alphaproteobacteria bacterium]
MRFERIPGFSTRAIHAGATPASLNKTVDHQAASLVSVENVHTLYMMRQYIPENPETEGHPVCVALEERVAALEGGTAAVAVSSINTAQFLVFYALMEPGDEFVTARQPSGSLISRFCEVPGKCGWKVKWAEIDDISTFENAITPRTKAIFVETIANSGGKITDIQAISKVAHRARVPLIVDNSLASPYLCRPIEHGADIVLHNISHFLSNHGNITGGIIVEAGSFNWLQGKKYPTFCKPCPFYNGKVLAEEFGNFAFATACRALSLNNFEAALPPFKALMVLDSIETLPLRMQRHCDNARSVAEFLNDHPDVAWINYAGLQGHRYYKQALKYCPDGIGATFTFGLNGTSDNVDKFISRVELLGMRNDAGGTRSALIRPMSIMPAGETTQNTHVTEGTIRLFVGLEDKADIIADLDQALSPTPKQDI